MIAEEHMDDRVSEARHLPVHEPDPVAQLLDDWRDGHPRFACDRHPDPAAPWLGELIAPALLVADEANACAPDLMQAAQRQVRCASELAVIPSSLNAPEKLNRPARLVTDWFTQQSEHAPVDGVHRVPLA
jgi:hypothetical protein